VRKKKKNDFVCVLVFCDVGRPILWLPALFVVVGVRWPAWCSGHQEEEEEKKKKKTQHCSCC
jgi:hypothetical protein